jgi:hypothetical protein
MKKIMLLATLITISCSKSTSDETIVDCNCDKVVEKQTFNIVGTPQNPAIQFHTLYTTINECTHIQKSKTFDTTNSALIPQIGQCR